MSRWAGRPRGLSLCPLPGAEALYDFKFLYATAVWVGPMHALCGGGPGAWGQPAFLAPAPCWTGGLPRHQHVQAPAGIFPGPQSTAFSW